MFEVAEPSVPSVLRVFDLLNVVYRCYVNSECGWLCFSNSPFRLLHAKTIWLLRLSQLSMSILAVVVGDCHRTRRTQTRTAHLVFLVVTRVLEL